MVSDFAKIAGIIGFLGYIPYIFAILKRKTFPNPATWWIWSIIGWAAFVSYFAAGGDETFWLMLSYAIGPSAIAILSLKYGKGGLDKFDICCLIISCVSLLAWIITSNPSIALATNLGIDITGSLPTLRKTYLEPETEDGLSWCVFWVGNTINFLTVLFIDNLTFSTVAYPFYLFILASIMMILISRKWAFRLVSTMAEK
ncbi:hypothetical protein C7271_00125 [filamentous cyanobacterium CCP5]|nr:hypothetical protein C7271_00125 [filamentous cyanobacterium CCP5]